MGNPILHNKHTTGQEYEKDNNQPQRAERAGHISVQYLIGTIKIYRDNDGRAGQIQDNHRRNKLLSFRLPEYLEIFDN